MPYKITPKECVWCGSKGNLEKIVKRMMGERNLTESYYRCGKCSEPRFRCGGGCWCRK